MSKVPIIKADNIRLSLGASSGCLVNHLRSHDVELEEGVRFNVSEVDCVGIKCELCLLQIDNLDLDYLVNHNHITKEEALKYMLDLKE